MEPTDEQLFDRINNPNCMNLYSIKDCIGENGKIIAYLLSSLGNLFVIEFSKKIVISRSAKDGVWLNVVEGGLTCDTDPVHIILISLSSSRMLFEIYSHDMNKKFINLTEDEYIKHVNMMATKIFNTISTNGIYLEDCSHFNSHWFRMNQTSDLNLNKHLRDFANFWYPQDSKLIEKYIVTQ